LKDDILIIQVQSAITIISLEVNFNGGNDFLNGRVPIQFVDTRATQFQNSTLTIQIISLLFEVTFTQRPLSEVTGLINATLVNIILQLNPIPVFNEPSLLFLIQSVNFLEFTGIMACI